MKIVITAWALDSYLDLKHSGVFSSEEYKTKIRPDVLLLKQYPPGDTKFQNSKFWSVATDASRKWIHDGYKMKWRQVGNGKVQIRLCVGIVDEAILCEAFMKKTTKQEKRKLEVFRTHLDLIRLNQYTESGRL